MFECIDTFQREERVKFDYTDIECISNFIEDEFGLAYDHSEVSKFIV